MHIHIASVDTDNGSFVSEKFRSSFTAKHFYKAINITSKTIANLDNKQIDKLLQHNFIKLLNESSIDQVMLLGLDAAYKENGDIDQKNTKMVTSANFLNGFSKLSNKVIFAPSVHPYRKDALEELERVKAMGAKIIKWIPAAQNIDPESELCTAFYEKLKELNLALITHTCFEHAVVSFSQDLNHIRRLKRPLDMGVKVIAAHCATRLFVYERCQFFLFKNMINKYDNLYGDISAFNLPTRIKYLKEIRGNDKLLSRVFYGSDFPMKSLPISFLFNLGPKKYKFLKSIKNPLDLSFEITKAFMKNDKVFTNFSHFLNNL